MRLSLQEKEHFYRHLAQLLRSGVPIASAIDRLAVTARGSLARFLQRLRDALSRGVTLAEAFQEMRPAVSEMEQTAVEALERSGRLEQGLQQLGTYFEAMGRARSEILRGCAYPLFILHLGILLLNVPDLITGAGPEAYLRKTGTIFLAVYGIVLVLALIVHLLRDAGAQNPAVDRLLGVVPIIGKIRRSFAVARFCSTYEMQLNAGVNVIDSLLAAGRASRSGRISRAVDSSIPELRAGSQVGPLLARSRAFPETMIRSFVVGEDTGELDHTLEQLGAEYQQKALKHLGVLSEWLPRLIYLGILGFLAWNVIAGYKRYLDGAMSQFDSL